MQTWEAPIGKVKVGDHILKVEDVEIDSTVIAVNRKPGRVRIEFANKHAIEADTTAIIEIQAGGDIMLPAERAAVERRQVDPEADFAWRGLRIGAEAALAINHHLRNALQSLQDDNPDIRKRAIRRLRSLAHSIDVAYMRERKANDVV